MNSSGFVLIGSFTSHVTGNIGRLAIWLLGTIAVTFLVGALTGALSALHLQHGAMLLATLAVACCSLYAGFNERLAKTSREQSHFDRE